MFEWLRGESAPRKFWLSMLPPGTAVEQFIRLAKLRRRIERAYEERKDRWGWIMTGDGAGVGSPTAARFAERYTPSLPPSALGIPALRRCPPSRLFAYLEGSNHGGLPVLPERHVPSSIGTMGRIQSRSMLRDLPCISCGRGS